MSNSELQQRIIQAFQVEHKEQVDGIRAVLDSLREQAAGANDPRWDEAFRMAHTLKGGARVCDLRGVESLGHGMESLFAGVRSGTLPFDDRLAGAVLHVLDEIEDLMESLATGGTPRSDVESLREIEVLLEQADPGRSAGGAAPHAEPATAAAMDAEPADVAEASLPRLAAEIDSLRVPTEHLDAVLRSADAVFELNYDQQALTAELSRLQVNIRELQQNCESAYRLAGPALRRSSTDSGFEGVLRLMDGFQLQAVHVAKQVRAVRRSQQHLAWRLRAASDALRRSAQQTRLISAQNIFHGFRSVVRNLARDEGKDVEFVAAGMHVQADRRVLQSLKDPILHVLRNAIVHGIERPEERTACGKAPTGRITFTVATHGNQLKVTVDDDGRGIDTKAVARRAMNRGLIPAPVGGGDHPPADISDILFRAGFSTVDTVTELAGRGMGLSVVHETVDRLRGSVRISPLTDGGTRLELLAPLLITSERLLVISCNRQQYAIPTHAIDRIIKIAARDVQHLDSRRFIVLDEAPVSLCSLAEVLGFADAGHRVAGESQTVVIVRAGSKRLALSVDAVIAEREAMIKELDEPAASAPQYCGAVVLEDREVAPVIDTVGLSAGIHPSIRNSLKVAGSAKVTPPIVLVVDDSVTTRTLEKAILETNGYDVRVALNGVEALKVLRSEPIDLVVADVQMPKMDGLMLLAEIRRHAKLGSLPVILVTSLDRKEDYERGMELGANAYIVKQRFDHQQLLNTIQQFLRPVEAL